ncbi:MAG: type II toxin-antitoxin system HicA family toxin [Magnetococcales bacterium]|nr:type II toxin-antitoxin system HicA family toxin [Magnetococcales bacterium]
MNTTDLIKTLQKDGWQLVRVAGSHHPFKHPIKAGLVTVAHPKGHIKIGTLNSILKQAGLK